MDVELRIMRRIAWRLVPFLSLAYTINALDRFNISIISGYLAPQMVGLARNASGSYQVPMGLASLFMLAAAICIVLVPRPASAVTDAAHRQTARP